MSTKKKQQRNSFIYLILIALTLVVVLTFIPYDRPEEVDLSTFISQAKQGQIDTIKQDGDSLLGQ